MVCFGRLIGSCCVPATHQMVRTTVFRCADARFAYLTFFLCLSLQRSSNVILPDLICGCVRFSFGGRIGSFCVLATRKVVRATVFRCSDAHFTYLIFFQCLSL